MIPRSPAEVTPDWLTASLGAEARGAQVAGIEFEPLPSLTSTMHRLTVRYAGTSERLPHTVIWKQSAVDPAVRDAFGHAAGSAYQREVAFYREIAATIETRTPRCYLAEYDASSDEHVLLLEDLEGSHHVGAPLGISVAAVRGVLRELAHLHAARWNAVERRAPPFSRDATPRFFDEQFTAGHAYLEAAVGAETWASSSLFAIATSPGKTACRPARSLWCTPTLTRPMCW